MLLLSKKVFSTLAPNFMMPRIVTGVYNDGLNYDGFIYE